jgi:hypothetical protein
MSRLTGTDAYGLMEAYNNVYAPQELTEEQVWEEVETWVNDLIEEGYDLSDYTWEEMYESYLEEQGGRGSSTASQTNQSANIPNPFPATSKFFKGSGGAGTTGGRQTNTRGGGPSRPEMLTKILWIWKICSTLEHLEYLLLLPLELLLLTLKQLS